MTVCPGGADDQGGGNDHLGAFSEAVGHLIAGHAVGNAAKDAGEDEYAGDLLEIPAPHCAAYGG